MLIRHASWIRMKDASSLVVPVFRRTFTCPGRIRTATLEVTCDGVYEALLNGSRVGSFILAPGWTQYNKRLQVQRYDITGLLQENNALEVTVGNGWFRRTNAPWTGTQNPDEFLPAMLIAALHIVYEDGSEEVILTDVCPFTLGTEVVRNNGSFEIPGVYLPIIERNSVIPVSRKQVVTTARDDQEYVTVKILQGESRVASNNLLLGADCLVITTK